MSNVVTDEKAIRGPVWLLTFADRTAISASPSASGLLLYISPDGAMTITYSEPDGKEITDWVAPGEWCTVEILGHRELNEDGSASVTEHSDREYYTCGCVFDE